MIARQERLRARSGGAAVVMAALLSTAGFAQCRFGGVMAVPTLQPGDLAPEFSLQATDDTTYTLSELKGKYVVLAWFAKAFTGG